MGKALRDCAECGAPVGRIGRELCCRCWGRAKQEAARAACPDCGRIFVLDPATGRCVRCSHRCTQCGHTLRLRGSVLCKECRRKQWAQAAKLPCPRCGKPGLLRENTGWCGPCSHPGSPKKPPRECARCGRLFRRGGLGLCTMCYQQTPERVLVRAENLASRLTDPPPWLLDFAAHITGPHNPGRAAALITGLGRLLTDGGPTHPQALLERARTPGRSIGPLARTLEEYFVGRGLALRLDQAQRRAAERRRSRVLATPEPLRALVADFEAAMMGERERSRRAGTRPRADSTIEHHLATARDFAIFLIDHRGKRDWALVDVSDVEAFLATRPPMAKSWLSGLRRLMRTARARRVILIDPTAGLSVREPRAFHGQILDRGRQRQLYRRWSQQRDIHPHEAFVGLAALLHGASIQELRFLLLDDLDHTRHRLHLGKRPASVPVDPVTWAALESCLSHRAALKSPNPHVIVTKGTKLNSAPASHYYMTHVLDPAELTPTTARNTRLTDLAATLDPKILAAAFGMDPEGALYYSADRVDAQRITVKSTGPNSRGRS
jgi:hypothetical protein